MFQKLVNHNEDIERLVKKGYAVGFDSGYLVIRDIPYLNEKRELQWGVIVSKLVFTDEVRVVQDDHQIFFAGTHPHGLDSNPIPNLGGGEVSLTLSDLSADVIVQRSFSNKPRINGELVGFSDFFEKIESYVGILSGPAIALHEVSPYTFRVTETVADSVFEFHDTMTSRAEIGDLSAKFKDDVIAIIGLGGTGAYIMDFLVRTPVREIRAFDADKFYVHNAYRSPGKISSSEFNIPKAEVYRDRYKDFRTGISTAVKFIDSSSEEELDGVTFAFVCVDSGSSRAAIFDLLISKNIPFIDVGMGLTRRKDSSLAGMLRATYFAPEKAEAVKDKNYASLTDPADDIYRANIQIGELNAMNACLAVVTYKQIRGFYTADVSYENLLFDISDLKTAGNEYEI